MLDKIKHNFDKITYTFLNLKFNHKCAFNSEECTEISNFCKINKCNLIDFNYKIKTNIIINVNDMGISIGNELSECYHKHCKNELKKFRIQNPDIFKYEFIEISKIIDKFLKKEKFSFCRFSDGEYHAMFPKYNYKTLDLQIIQGKETKIGNKLHEIIKFNEKNFKIGIIMSYVKQVPTITLDLIKLINNYDNLWPALGGHSNIKTLLLEYIINNKYPIVLIGNENINPKNIKVNIQEFVPISSDGIAYYEKNSDYFIEKIKLLVNKYRNTVFIISAGMLANVICFEGWKQNKNNWYLDMGSTITRKPYLFGITKKFGSTDFTKI